MLRLLSALLLPVLALTANAQTNIGGALSDSTTGPLLSGTVYHASSISVPPGQTLTIQPGVIIKFALSTTFEVSGTLLINGTAGSPVYLTERRDDSVGGDTNGDGPSTGVPGSWVYWRFYGSSSASVINHAVARFGGGAGWSPVRLQSSATFSNSIVENGLNDGIVIASSLVQPAITGCTIRNNTGNAFSGANFFNVVNFANNSATGNGGNAVVISDTSLPQDATVPATAGINGVFVPAGSITIGGGRSLTLGAGSIVKFPGNFAFFVTGTLITNGTVPAPVVFTTWTDDAYGGDSNANGASSGTPGAWQLLRFFAGSSESRLNGTYVRYAGSGGNAGVSIEGSNLQMLGTTVENCASTGISLGGSSSRPVIARCAIRNNGGVAIGGAQIGAVPLITRNTATGNALNQLNVSSCSLTEDLYIDGDAGVNGAVVMGTGISIPVGRTLTLGPGAAFKLNTAALGVDVSGSLIVRGTQAAPVIFTDRRDDTVGGDTDGAGGSPVPGGWFRLSCQSFATNVDVEHLTLRYSGSSGFASVRTQSTTVSLRNVRVERAGGPGFELTNAGRAEFLSAWSCAGTGISLHGGAFDLRHATANTCASGIAQVGGVWTGQVVDSIAWGNAANYSGLTMGQVHHSDGFTGGGLGNLNVDPMFVNAPTGNLHLQLGSPVVGAGDPLSPLDSDCSTADMGAYPQLAPNGPTFYCTGKLNSAGCTSFMAFSGYASASSAEPFQVRAYHVLNNKNGLFFYGLNGPLSAPFQGGLKCVANPVKRLPILNSNGNASLNDCSGVFEFDFNAFIQGGSDAQLVPGATVNAQCWYRDPGVFSTTGLSNGLEFEICN